MINDITSVANETIASFLGFSINGIFNQLVARKYEIDSTMMQRMTAIDGESVYYTVSNVASISDEVGSKKSSFITLQVPVSGVYLMTTSIHCTTRPQVKQALAFSCASEIDFSTMTLLNTLAGLKINFLSTDFDVRLQQNDYVASTSSLVTLTANKNQSVTVAIADLHDVSLVRYAVQLVLYEPVNADNKVARSVKSTSLSISDISRSPIVVTINEGGAYDNASNSVIIPVTGVYYLMLTVIASVTSSSTHRVLLNANTTVLEDNRRQSTVSSIFDFGTRDKSILLSLATGNVLTYNFSLSRQNYLRSFMLASVDFYSFRNS
jgi:hypothetical protein